MNYGDHSFIEITQQTKLRVALVVPSESSCAVWQCRHSQNAWARHVERIESSGIWALQSISSVMFNGRKHIFRPIVNVTLIQSLKLCPGSQNEKSAPVGRG